MKTQIAMTLTSCVLVAVSAFGSWYENPVVKSSVDVGFSNTDPQFLAKSADEAYLAVPLNYNIYAPVKVWRISELVSKPRFAAECSIHSQDMNGLQTSGTPTGCAISSDFLIPGAGNGTPTGKTVSLKLEQGGWQLERTAWTQEFGVQFNSLVFASTTGRLYSNDYTSGSRNKIHTWGYANLDVNYGIAEIGTAFADTGVDRIRSLSLATIGGNDIIYYGEGTKNVATSGKVFAIDTTVSPWSAQVVVDTGLSNEEISCVKLSGTKSGTPVLYVLTDSGVMKVYALNADGLDGATLVKTFDAAQLSQLSGLSSAPSTGKFRNFEVTDDGAYAFFMYGNNGGDCNNPDGKPMFTVVANSATIEPITEVFPPELDGYVNVSLPDVISKGGIVADSYREGVMRLDVNGMENVERAILRLYVVQHDDRDVNPILLRQMVDPDFKETEMTWNGLRHEFQCPSGLTPALSPDDPQVIACSRCTGLNTWTEFDITAAVKREAARTGKLAFIVSAMGWRGSYEKPTAFSGTATSETCPQFVVTWPKGECRSDTNLWANCPCTDVFTAENGGSTIRNADGLFLSNRQTREAYFKFDLAKIAGTGKGRVRRAMLKLVPYDGNTPTAAAYILSHDNVAWQASDYPAGSRQKPLPNGLNGVSTDVSKGIRFGGTWSKTQPNEGEITRLVQEALDKGHDKLSLSLVVDDGGYAIGYTGDRNVELRVDMQPDGVESAPPAWARLAQQTRETLAYAQINSWLDPTYIDCSKSNSKELVQTGSSDSGSTKRILHSFFLADPTGLENAPYVRLRVKVGKADNASMHWRLFGRATPDWDCMKVTWGNVMSEFAETINNGNNPRVLSGDASAPNQLVCFRHDIGATSATTKNYLPYIEFDVTDVAHEAARKGLHLTFMLASSDNEGWQYFHTELAADAKTRPCLVYPTPCEFAQELVATVGESVKDGHKTAILTWTADPIEGTAYTVSRRTVGKADETVVTKAPLTSPTFTDAKARSDCDYVYTITAIHPDGTMAVATIQNRIDNTVTIANVLDGFAQNGGGKANNANWTSSLIVMKDGGDYDNGGTREGFVRFPLADVPEGVIKVTLALRNGALSNHTYNETLCFRVAPDVDKTDDDPPTWTDLFGSQVIPSKPSADGVFATRALVQGAMTDYGVVEQDVTAQVLAAKARGDRHIVFHTFLDDPNCAMAFGFMAKESPYVDSAPHLVCERRSAAFDGLIVILR